jgi:hypothetical protein
MGVVVALVLPGKTECSICGGVIMDHDEVVATSHFIADRNDPLWRFSDSAMHRRCFVAWGWKAEFVTRFNQIVGEITFGNGTYQQMDSEGAIAVLKRSG